MQSSVIKHDLPTKKSDDNLFFGDGDSAYCWWMESINSWAT